MSLFIKLCGLRTPADVESAVDAGANAVGFVMTESPRQVSVAQAARLRSLLPAEVLAVAVLNDPSPGLVQRTSAEVAPDLFQVELQKVSGLPLDRILPVVVDGDGLEDAVARALNATQTGMVLVDSAAKGGTGNRSDWDRLATLETRDRVVVAGGLDPGNVGDAISRIQPFGVDVSSGIERQLGEKDPELMRAFVKAARAAEMRGARL
ncbi:MAG: phosphoribosylanthranilate isomerase [Acidimicrobiia bacterium]